ncbi:hypothetical protein BDW62DRAFT_194370 [Aspergillus aurantiobrunneus]
MVKLSIKPGSSSPANILLCSKTSLDSLACLASNPFLTPPTQGPAIQHAHPRPHRPPPSPYRGRRKSVPLTDTTMTEPKSLCPTTTSSRTAECARASWIISVATARARSIGNAIKPTKEFFTWISEPLGMTAVVPTMIETDVVMLDGWTWLVLFCAIM